MRSRVVSVKDPASIDLSPYLRPFVLDQAKLDRELARLANPYVRWEKGTTVSEGDMVICRLTSGYPRFNKDKVKFVAGSGMFHKELETLAIGMTVGETREVELPEGRAALTVTDVTNKVVPPVSDDMVKRLGLHDVHTVADYTAYLARQQQEQVLEELLYEPLQYMIHEMIDQSEFVLCQEDWQHAVDLRLDRSRVLFRQEGLVMEELTAPQFEGRIPVKSYHELVALEQRESWTSLCMHLLGRYYAEQDGFCPDEAGYAQYIREYMEGWHISEEEARETDPYTFYAFFAYVGHARKHFVAIIKNQFMMEG